MSRKEGQGMNRREFIKAAGMAGLGAAALEFGVPTLLRAAEAKPIKIGSVQPVTGPLAVVGQNMRKAAQLAVDQINAAGGIKAKGGAKLELVLADSESKADVGRMEADRLIKEGVAMIVGPFQSDTAMAIATLCEQRNAPFLIDVGTMDEITQKGYKNTFRVFPTGSIFGVSTVKFLKLIMEEKKVSIKRAVLTNTGDAFGKSQSSIWLKAIKESGLGIEVVEQITYPLGIQDLSAEVAKIKAAKPDILCPVSRPGDSTIMVRELYKQRVELMGIISPGGPGWYETEVVKDLGNLLFYAIDNVPSVNPASPIFQAANKAFQEKFGINIDANSGYGYMAILVAADVLERTASLKPEDVVAAIRKTDFKDHPMVGGPVQFADNGDNKGATTAFIQIQPDDDPLKRVKVIWPKEFAQAPYVFPAPQLWDRK